MTCELCNKPANKVGRPGNPRRKAICEKFGVKSVGKKHFITNGLLDQLDACADDSARRLLLGKGEREAA